MYMCMRKCKYTYTEFKSDLCCRHASNPRVACCLHDSCTPHSFYFTLSLLKTPSVTQKHTRTRPLNQYWSNASWFNAIPHIFVCALIILNYILYVPGHAERSIETCTLVCTIHQTHMNTHTYTDMQTRSLQPPHLISRSPWLHENLPEITLWSFSCRYKRTYIRMQPCAHARKHTRAHAHTHTPCDLTYTT